MDELRVALVAGVAAGLGVAMPLGAIGALLLREGVVNGGRVAAAGATAVAVVDTAYCTVAMIAGTGVASLVKGRESVFLVVSGSLVVAVGLHQFVTTLRGRPGEAGPVERASAAATFTRFLALTAVNPITLVYFVALAGALSTRTSSWLAPTVFVVAVGVSSWAWQLLLAGLGATFGRSLGPRATSVLGTAASAIIVALGAAIVVNGLRAGPVVW